MITELLESALELARRQGLHRLWLVTTNDNLDALRSYQRRGLRIVGIGPGAVDAARELRRRSHWWATTAYRCTTK